nr:hypothetical protein [Tanacetum cinerariifolium]
MDAPPSPTHMIDFLANEPVLELEDPVMEVEEDPKEDSDMDIDENEEDECASSTVPEAPYLVGRPLLVVAARVSLHHEEIGTFCMRADKMEFMQTSLVRKVDELCGQEERLIADRVVEAIVEHDRNRPNPVNTGGVIAPNVHGCTYKTFMNGKPHPFNETEGVVGLRRWFKKVEQVFEISKCAEDGKVKFAACTFEGPLMTTEYCPATKIQRIEQELWTLTLKGDDIKGYNNRFHELALMCPELVTPKKKKIKLYIRGLPEIIKANVTSSKPVNLNDAINMARELFEQAIQAKSTRIGESNKRRSRLGVFVFISFAGDINSLVHSRLLLEYYCLSPTTATLSLLYHESLIASVAKVNIVNRSIGTENPRSVDGNTTLTCHLGSCRLLALAFGRRLTNVSLFFSLLLMILKNHAAKETPSQCNIVLISCFVLAILK